MTKEGFQITFAKKGVFELKGNKKILVLYDGQTLTQNGKNITNLIFLNQILDYPIWILILVTGHKKLQEQSNNNSP